MNRHIVRGAVASVVFTCTSVLVAVVQLRLIVRFLPSDLAGLWLLFLTIGSYVLFFDLGISPTVGREMSFALGSKLTELERAQRIGELLLTLRRMVRIIAAGASAFSLIIGEFLLLSSPYRDNRALQLSWAIFSLGAGLNLLAGAGFTGLFGLGRVATEKLLRSISLAIGLSLTATALFSGFGVVGLSIAWASQGIVSMALAWFYLRRSLPVPLPGLVRPRTALAKKLLAPSLKLAFIQLGAILILQSANPLIAIMIGTSVIPAYEAISKIAATLMTLALLIVNSSAPYFSISYAAGELEELKQLLVRNLQVGVGLIIILAGFVAINGDRIVNLWLGSSMFAGFFVLWALLLMVLMEVHHVIFATAVLAVGQIVFVWAALISGILNIILAVVLAPKFGLLGIACAVASAQLLTNNWYAPWFAIRYFRLPVAKLLREVWVPLLVLLASDIVLNLLLRRVVGLRQPGWFGLGLTFVVSTSAGVVLWMLLVLRHGDRLHLLRLIHGRRKLGMEQA